MKQRSPTPPIACPAAPPPVRPSAPPAAASAAPEAPAQTAVDFGEFFSAGEVAAEGPALLAGLAAAVAPAAWHTAPRLQRMAWARGWAQRLAAGEPLASGECLDEQLAEDCARQHQAAEALAAVAIGAGHPPLPSLAAYAAALHQNAAVLWEAEVLPAVLQLLCSLLHAHSLDPIGELPRLLLAHCCTVLYCLLLAGPDPAALRGALTRFARRGEGLVAVLLHALKGHAEPAPGPPFLPRKKLLLLLWRVLDLVFDLPTPVTAVPPRSGVRVHAGDVTRYIEGICQTPPAADLSPEYLLLYYYGRFDAVAHPAFAPYVQPDTAEFDRLAIPVPIREALDLLARRHQEQYQASVERLGPQPPLHPSTVSAPFAWQAAPPATGGKPSGAEPHSDDEEEEDGAEEEDDVDSGMEEQDCSAPHVPRALQPTPAPPEQLYRTLLPILSPVLLALLRPFLAALPKATSAQVDWEAELPNANVDDFEAVQRHKDIVLRAVLAVLLRLWRALHRHHPLQAACLAGGLCSANGLLLLLKFLNQREPLGFVACPQPSAAAAEWEELAHSPAALLLEGTARGPTLSAEEAPADLPGGGGATALLPGEGGAPVPVLRRRLAAVVAAVQLVHKLTKGNISRLSVLCSYKVHVIMKRLLKLSDPDLAVATAKVLKSVQRSTGRKWRAANMRVYSAVYRYVRHDLADCRVHSETSADTSDPLEGPRPVGHTTDQEEDRAVRRFNRREYRCCLEPAPLKTAAEEDEDDREEEEFHRAYLAWYTARYGRDPAL